MNNNTNINISYSDDDEKEEDESPIINNNDEFGAVNDLPQKENNKSIENVNKLEHHRAKSKKLNENYKINTPKTKLPIPHMNLYSLLLHGDDNLYIDNKNKIKKCKIKQKKQNPNIKKYYRCIKNGKSVFIKISEDIYTKFKSKPNKEVRDIIKMEEDAYNKMTSEPYINAWEDKENLKNKKIVQEFLDRKAKEDTNKKIGIECDKKDQMTKLQDPKRALSVTDRNINFKSTRTLAQFLEDQKYKNNIDRKNKIKNNKKIPLPIKGNILPQDSTFIFSENKNFDNYSEYSKNLDKLNFDNISMDYNNDSILKKNNKYNSNEEKEKIVNKTFEMEKELINPGNNFSLINTKNPKKKQNNLIKDKNNKNETLKKNLFKKKNKKEMNIKESSSTSTSKKSIENTSRKFLNLYKDTLLNCLGQKIENEFDINYSAFLLILYKVGFTNRNYSILLESSEIEIDNQSLHAKELSDFSISNSSLSFSQMSTKKVGKFSLAGKSLEDEAEKYNNTYKNEKEFQLSRDGWKIITEKQNFDEDIGISSKKMFLFYISVLGLFKDEKMKKEYNFFFSDKKLVQQYNNINKYIYKYFGLYKLNAMDHLLLPEKREKILTSNSNSLISSFTVSNLDNSSSSKNYDIYGKNYNNINSNTNNTNKKNNNITDDDINSIRLFTAGINKENNFYDNKKNKDKSSKSIISLTDYDHGDNNSMYFLNYSISDNSSFSDLKKIFKENPIEKKEDDSDDLDIESFLLEENKNYFHYGTQKSKNKSNYSNYTDIKSYIQDDEENDGGKKNVGKKKIKYVFEIKIEDKPKKLILRKGDDKNNIITNFCKKYGINDENEKNKLIEVIDERLKNLEHNNKIKKK